ncbi:MAG: DUF3450 domain-containing protein [bacterium]|nr:DUF3450 domain-containing protein [bacterium]
MNCLTLSHHPGHPGAPDREASARTPVGPDVNPCRGFLPRLLHAERALIALALILPVVCIAAPALAEGVSDVVAVEIEGNESAAKSQTRIDSISSQTDDLAVRYRQTLEEIDGLRSYNTQLDRLLESQADELASLRSQIDRLTGMGRQMTPLMLRMLDRLEEFIELDIPLHLEERRGRIARLREMMNRADVTNAEKYRRIMEAYQIENEYGRTVEAYQETMLIDGEERTFDFLSFGRVALIYQSLDAEESAFWDQQTRSWISLPDGSKSAVRKGLRIARKQSAPDLVRLPIPAPVAANGGAAQ